MMEGDLFPAPVLDVAGAQALRAADCKRMFAVHGLFYDVPIGGATWSCRSVLELIAHDLVPAGDASPVLDRRPDLLVVMMNPGSSRSVDGSFTPPRVSDARAIKGVRRLVETIPDTTQYQVMKVMAARGWRHARVLNLSDLRETKSPNLFRHVQALAGLPDGDAHSIFSDARRDELLGHIGPPQGSPPVILGWGRHKTLFPLAEKCLAALEGRVMVGVQAPEGPLAYAHPSPMMQKAKDAWIERILGLLDEAGL
ncbi:hypothetical protein [Caenispirillum salinarum]|uniref:hypothetical protein n=1 Tax=Caenispirillum salinarum TaxID=859058 RepID=UPI00384A9451